MGWFLLVLLDHDPICHVANGASIVPSVLPRKTLLHKLAGCQASRRTPAPPVHWVRHMSLSGETAWVGWGAWGGVTDEFDLGSDGRPES